MHSAILTVPEDAPQWMINRWSGESEPSNAERTGLSGKDFPLPVHTPFDQDEAARGAYIDGFAHGVQWLLFARGSDNYLHNQVLTLKDKAWQEGFGEGRQLAFQKIAERNHQMFQPATAVPAARSPQR